MLSRNSAVEKRNDENNKDEPYTIHHHYDYIPSDDCNKEVDDNTTSCGTDGSNKQSLGNKTSNTSYYGHIMECLFIVVCCQFVRCKQQAASGLTVYKRTVCLTITVSVYFDITITLAFGITILQWMELIVRYWQQLLNIMIEYLKKPINNDIQQWKKLTHQCYQSLCTAPSFPVMLQHHDLSHSATDLLDKCCSVVSLQIVKFSNPLLNVVLLVHNAPTRLTSHMFMISSGLFLCFHKQFQYIKSFIKGAGRRASDRSDSNGKRSQSESSKQSGSAGRSTSSSMTGGICYTGRTGSTSGGSGSSSGGDDGDDDDWRNRDRFLSGILEWEEDDAKDENEVSSDITTTCNAPRESKDDNTARESKDSKAQTPRESKDDKALWENKDSSALRESKDGNTFRKSKGSNTPGEIKDGNTPRKSNDKKASHKTAEPIFYDYALKCENGWLYWFMVTSPMMNMPLPGNELECRNDGRTNYTTAAAANSVTDQCSYEGYCYKVLYTGDVPRTYSNLRMLCLLFYCCEPVVTQACSEDVALHHDSARKTEALSVIALLPPPGGGSDEQFKDVLMVICTVVAAAYCYLHDNNIYFDPSDFDVHKIFVTRDLDTSKIISVSIHAVPRQLEGADKDDVKADTNKGLMSLASSICSRYKHTEYRDMGERILTIVSHVTPYEKDLDVLYSLLEFHYSCPPFDDNAIVLVQ